MGNHPVLTTTFLRGDSLLFLSAEGTSRGCPEEGQLGESDRPKFVPALLLTDCGIMAKFINFFEITETSRLKLRNLPNFYRLIV